MRELFSLFRAFGQRRAPVEWVTAFLALGISLMFVLRTGPQIQAYVLALINNDATSIYGTFYHNDLV